MTKALTTAAFDYSKVDKDAKGKLINLAGRINQHGDKMTALGNEIGTDILEAHKLLAISRGKPKRDAESGLFNEWVESETTISLQTAYNCLNAAKRTLNFPIIGKLQPTVAYLLSAPKVPDEAIELVENLAGKGEKITIKKAKEVIKRFKAAVERPKSSPAPAPTATPGPCPHGGEHTYDEEACTLCHDPKPDGKEVGKKFKALLDLLGHAVRIADEINRDAPHKLHADVFESLDCASKDIHKWRSAVK